MKKLAIVFLLVLVCTEGYAQLMIEFLGKNVKEVRLICRENNMTQEEYMLETTEKFGSLIMSNDEQNVYGFFFDNGICIKSVLTTAAYLYAGLIPVLNKEYDRIDDTHWKSEEGDIYVTTRVAKYLTITFKYKGY